MWKSTNSHLRYWQERKINWKTDYFDTWNHPHRQLIIEELKRLRFGSLMEIGCASGPNLFRIQQAFPKCQLGGIDANAEAIELARQLVPTAAHALEPGCADDLFFSDKCTDVVLTDMALIYIGPGKIKKVLREIKRITRNNIILCEFYSSSWWRRWSLRLASGYNAHDYPGLLEAQGFYDVECKKIPLEAWPGGEPQATFGFIITAKL